MISKNKIEMGKKTISLFEIIILVVSIVALGYFLGDEFRIVSASDSGGPTGASCTYNKITYKDGSFREFNPNNKPSDSKCNPSKTATRCREACVNGVWGELLKTHNAIVMIYLQLEL